MWNSPGAPYYLVRQIKRMQSTPLLSKKAESLKPLVQIARLLSQLCGRYDAAVKNAREGVPLFGKLELDGIKGTLAECEKELVTLHLGAACAEDMMADAYKALSIDAPVRAFTIVADADSGGLELSKENGKHGLRGSGGTG